MQRHNLSKCLWLPSALFTLVAGVLGSVTDTHAGPISWTQIDVARDVAAMAGLNGNLFVATTSNQLLVRQPNGVWIDIGHANNVAAMTSVDNLVFAATSDNKLWVREPVLREVFPNWTQIGHANNVMALASLPGNPSRLFAATSDNKLWVREPVLREVNWTQIGHANNIVGMTGASGLLFALSDGQLWIRVPSHSDLNWHTLPFADGQFRRLATVGNQLFAIWNDDVLLASPIPTAGSDEWCGNIYTGGEMLSCDSGLTCKPRSGSETKTLDYFCQ
jgi:hypothetical protein